MNADSIVTHWCPLYSGFSGRLCGRHVNGRLKGRPTRNVSVAPHRVAIYGRLVPQGAPWGTQANSDHLRSG